MPLLSRLSRVFQTGILENCLKCKNTKGCQNIRIYYYDWHLLYNNTLADIIAVPKVVISPVLILYLTIGNNTRITVMAFEFAANSANDMLRHWWLRHPLTVHSHPVRDVEPHCQCSHVTLVASIWCYINNSFCTKFELLLIINFAFYGGCVRFV